MIGKSMSYQTKYIIGLVILVIGCLFVVDGFNELRSSFGASQLLSSGAIKLIIGVPAILIGGPMFYYYYSRNKIGKHPIETEIEMDILRHNATDRTDSDKKHE